MAMEQITFRLAIAVSAITFAIFGGWAYIEWLQLQSIEGNVLLHACIAYGIPPLTMFLYYLIRWIVTGKVRPINVLANPPSAEK